MKYQLTHPNAKRPTKNNEEDACWDLFTPEEVYIHPGERVTVNTGFRCELPINHDAVIRPKSKLAKNKGLIIGGGEIDNKYRKDWGVVLINTGSETIYFSTGEAIAQFRFVEKILPDEEFTEGEVNEYEGRKTGIWS